MGTSKLFVAFLLLSPSFPEYLQKKEFAGYLCTINEKSYYNLL